MKQSRVEIKMIFSANLDQVKGWGDKPGDWVEVLRQRIGADSGGPYDIKLTVTDINFRGARP